MKSRLLVTRLAALLLALALAVSLPLLLSDTARAVDLTQPCALTIKAGAFTEQADLDDLAGANVVIDLYKVADAVADDGYSTYSFNVDSGYTLSHPLDSYENLMQLTSADWDDLAQDAAKAVLTSGQTFAKETTGNAGENIDGLDCGLYLVIAHGADLTEYTETAEDGSLVTFANSNEYTYSFLPALIALPSTAADVTRTTDANGDPEAVTTDGGDWQFDVSATLKATREPRFGDLEILKTVSTYGTRATCVFRVEATLEDTVVYSDVVGLNITAAGTSTIAIRGRLPVGATVTVTEIYSGASYSLTTSATQTAVIAPPGEPTAQVQFTNDYDETTTSGDGIVNQFFRDDTGHWDVDNTGDNAE
ncbi:MAG: hypothetical protein IJ751_01965 [Oscillospiraceae bacterium]|nr:hypothetical protein [Oscillospiraceae bacterium]